MNFQENIQKLIHIWILRIIEKTIQRRIEQISILTKTIHDNVGAKGAIKHYIEDHGSVPLWVLVNYLTIGKSFHICMVH